MGLQPAAVPEVKGKRIERERIVAVVPGCDAECVQCESGWVAQATNPAGYWGLYQFDFGTWVAHGGDPAQYGNAPAGEQHRIASRIRYDAWPNC